MTAEKKSRAEITRDAKGGILLCIYCEKLKKVLPVTGLNYKSALVVANLLVEIQRNGMSLPEQVIDSTKVLPA
jgi:hypothetical protein